VADRPYVPVKERASVRPFCPCDGCALHVQRSVVQAGQDLRGGYGRHEVAATWTGSPPRARPAGRRRRPPPPPFVSPCRSRLDRVAPMVGRSAWPRSLGRLAWTGSPPLVVRSAGLAVFVRPFVRSDRVAPLVGRSAGLAVAVRSVGQGRPPPPRPHYRQVTCWTRAAAVPVGAVLDLAE
jgi:hypothetical protein